MELDDDKSEIVSKPDETLYASDRNEIGATELREFIGGITKSLELGFKEPLTEETKKLQRGLVLLSFAVLLISTHAIVLDGAVKSNGFSFSIAPRILLWIGLVASAYLEILVSVKSYGDWKLYRLKNALAERELETVLYDFRKEGPPRPFETTAEGLRFIRARRREQVNERPIEGVEAERVTAEREYERRMEILTKKKRWFYNHYVSLIGARRGRFFIEIFFPIFAGLVAIVSCAWALKHS